mmetsp:Transcript_34362/g.51874  ORF Transcript_34362/g.51874 Transcript_34362/m.51874 type:complete len:94 (+) Transcript_34362:406-687(+)
MAVVLTKITDRFRTFKSNQLVVLAKNFVLLKKIFLGIYGSDTIKHPERRRCQEGVNITDINTGCFSCFGGTSLHSGFAKMILSFVNFIANAYL